MLSSSLYTMLKLSKNLSPQKLSNYDCVTLYIDCHLTWDLHIKYQLTTVKFQVCDDVGDCPGANAIPRLIERACTNVLLPKLYIYDGLWPRDYVENLHFSWMTSNILGAVLTVTKPHCENDDSTCIILDPEWMSYMISQWRIWSRDAVGSLVLPYSLVGILLKQRRSHRSPVCKEYRFITTSWGH